MKLRSVSFWDKSNKNTASITTVYLWNASFSFLIQYSNNNSLRFFDSITLFSYPNRIFFWHFHWSIPSFSLVISTGNLIQITFSASKKKQTPSLFFDTCFYFFKYFIFLKFFSCSCFLFLFNTPPTHSRQD